MVLADYAAFFGDEALGVQLVVSAAGTPIGALELAGGLEAIIQGNGDNDIATLDCGLLENVGALNYAQNVFISQGAAIFTPGCVQAVGDTINVNCTYVYSSMTLEQGEGDTTGADLGSNVINVATTMPVFVGDETVIHEIGANNGQNNINLGRHPRQRFA